MLEREGGFGRLRMETADDLEDCASVAAVFGENDRRLVDRVGGTVGQQSLVVVVEDDQCAVLLTDERSFYDQPPVIAEVLPFVNDDRVVALVAGGGEFVEGGV